ncbi:hypothetical protein LEMLEM_LOCUS26889, partial [Lemmus lemmus]
GHPKQGTPLLHSCSQENLSGFPPFTGKDFWERIKRTHSAPEESIRWLPLQETHVCTASDSRQTRGRCAEVELGREATLQTAAVCTAPLRP